MQRVLQIIMAILMIAAIYCTFACRILPSSVDTTYTKESKSEEMVIVIDPGHGGDDPGKVGNNGELEKEINLAISFKLKDSLEKAGYKVVLTRENDEGLYEEDSGNKKVADMKKRCSIIEEAKASLVVSIHQNSFSQSNVKGAQVFYYKYSSQGEQLAGAIQKSIKDIVDKENNRSIKENATYYMLIHTTCPTVIVECGFLSNAEEAKKLCDDNYQSLIAEAVFKGIDEYCKDTAE